MEIVENEAVSMGGFWPLTADSWNEYKGLGLYDSAR